MQEASEGRATPQREAVLVVEPTDLAGPRLRAALRGSERQVHLASTAAEGLGVLAALRPALCFVSLELPDLEGPRAIEVFRQRSGVPVVALAGEPSVALAVEAVRRGAFDVIGAREEGARVREVADRALQGARTERQLQRVREEARDQYGFNQLLTQSPRMLQVFDQIRQVARTDATALILGETGTGKELVSRAIHDRSRRKEMPFISVNCGAFAETLLESELFGHERGSFTGAVGRREGLFEMADGGTLFLDELGETSLNVQVNLLRVLEDMTFRRVGGRDPVHVDVRIVAATNVLLEKAVTEGKFRQDLFYRLNVFPIRLPPLRERREDIPLLMRHFLDEIAAGYELEPPSISPDAMRAILAYRWPGNVRQLRAMCERWVIARANQRLEKDDLPHDMAERTGPPGGDPGVLHVDLSAPLKENLDRVSEELERAYLFRMLQKHRGHLGETATEAGITRRTLYTKMKLFGWQQSDFRG